MPRKIAIALAIGLLPASHCAGLFSVEVEYFDLANGLVPADWRDLSDGIQAGEVFNLSAAPFLDYMLPTTTGMAGILVRKAGGAHIESCSAAALGTLYGAGGASTAPLAGPDVYRPVFAWTDGDPVAAGANHTGYAWGGFSDSVNALLETRIHLPDTQPVLIRHFFSDSWDYTGHPILAGHQLRASLQDASGREKSGSLIILPGGEAAEIFGDTRQFYTALVYSDSHAAGDRIVISNEAANIAWWGTVVGRPGESPPRLAWLQGYWSVDRRLDRLFGAAREWVYSPTLKFFHDAYPWLWSPRLGWLFDYGLMSLPDGLFLHSPELGPLWVPGDGGGAAYVIASGSWTSL